jgi:glycerol-3-phosphate dehydrogenase (NAD(P)+)
MTKRVTVLGAGAWGCAFADLLATNGMDVTLWSYEPEVASAINTTHVNHRYLDGLTLHHSITATASLDQALADPDYIFEAVPVLYLRATLERVAATNAPSAQRACWVLLSKGLENETFMLPSQILDNVLGVQTRKAVIGGPNFARDLVQHALTATTLACNNQADAAELIAMLKNNFFKPYLSNDIIGVQVAGAAKNVLALAAGMAHGAGYKDNTIAFLLTQGLEEIAQLIVLLGGERQTTYSLAGLGDMLLTCTSTLSKNYRAGFLLGQGVQLNALTQHMPVIPEGINTTRSVQHLLEKHNLIDATCAQSESSQAASFRLFQGVYQCIFQAATLSDIVMTL